MVKYDAWPNGGNGARLCHLAYIVLAVVGLAACSPGQPTEPAAQGALSSVIDKGASSRLEVRALRKTDGRPAEINGVKTYDLMFEARAEFVTSAMFSIGGPFLSESGEITTAEYRPPATGFSWDDFMASSQGYRRASKGDVLSLSGVVGFERRESGWVPIAVRFRYGHSPGAEVTNVGACPFEGCQIGKWTARAETHTFDKPKGTERAKLRPGDVVVAVSTELVAVPRKATVTNVYRTDSNAGISVGDTVWVLHPIGEGAVAVWHEGAVKRGSLDLAVTYEEPLDVRPLTWTWWVEVRLVNGSTVWLKDPKDFDGMDAFG